MAIENWQDFSQNDKNCFKIKTFCQINNKVKICIEKA
jgi:hypothetical protein